MFTESISLKKTGVEYLCACMCVCASECVKMQLKDYNLVKVISDPTCP